jgi:NAD(P)H dehydrogenase (quinone)
MMLPTPKDLPIAFIDVRDTGALGARILIDPVPHVGKTYEFTGARTNYGEFADVFSQVLGKSITYVEATLEQTEQALRARGMPDWLVAHLLSIARITGKGGFSTENTELIRTIVKRAPITTRQFVEDHKSAFS